MANLSFEHTMLWEASKMKKSMKDSTKKKSTNDKSYDRAESSQQKEAIFNERKIGRMKIQDRKDTRRPSANSWNDNQLTELSLPSKYDHHQ